MSHPARPHRRDPRVDDYEIRVLGHLDASWAAWFGGWTLERDEDGTTRLTGTVVDQAALHGLLRRVRDLGVALISVARVPSAPGAASKEDDHV